MQKNNKASLKEFQHQLNLPSHGINIENYLLKKKELKMVKVLSKTILLLLKELKESLVFRKKLLPQFWELKLDMGVFKARTAF